MKPNHDLELGLEALRYIARGWSAGETGEQLRLSTETVKSRLRRLYGILGARNAAHAVAIAGMQRLLTPEDLKAALADRRAGWRAEDEVS